jgi:Zn-dependent M28 family amino/carboxypeptidase
MARLLFSGQSYDPVMNKGDYHSYNIKHTKISVTIGCKKKLIYSPNIIAIVPGTDPALRNEYITVSGHLDHLGKFENHVYNGANDDASACVIILEAARVIALNPLKRPVMFVLFTGEELNLIGSQHFNKHPAVPESDIHLNINIEQIGSKSRTFPGIWAFGAAQFKTDFYKSGTGLFTDKDMKYDAIDDNVDIIRNCDTYSFYTKHIPSVILSSGGFNEYHQPQDKIGLIDFDHLLNAADVLKSLVSELGNK